MTGLSDNTGPVAAAVVAVADATMVPTQEVQAGVAAVLADAVHLLLARAVEQAEPVSP
jgi:hypothetical protein